MRFAVSSTALLSHLQAVSRVINSKNTMAILDHFLFQIQDSTLKITASDLETTMITSMEIVDVEGSGTVAVAAKLLLDTLREFSEQPLTFEIDDENLAMVIYSDNGQYNFIGQNGDEYPSLPVLPDTAKAIQVPVAGLEDAIQSTFFATGDDDLRPVMMGIYFDFAPEQMTVVSTDAHKLVRFQHLEVHSEEPYSFILAKKAANMLRTILSKESGDVVIRFDDKNICFVFSTYTLYARQIEGRYPNYNAVIPMNNPYKLTVDRLVLLNAAKRVSVFSNQGTSLIKLQIEPEKVIISAQDIDFSISAEETIPCLYEGEPMSIGFKSSFLIDIINNLITESIIIELSDPSHAGIFMPFEQPENENILMLLMPMILNS